jgi:hypothetical protein
MHHDYVKYHFNRTIFFVFVPVGFNICLSRKEKKWIKMRNILGGE